MREFFQTSAFIGLPYWPVKVTIIPVRFPDEAPRQIRSEISRFVRANEGQQIVLMEAF
jgi:hypothetical protein